ncbi:putative RNA methyltransferase [Diplogelasinospora grovesii]|uniref:RNA methyltransferase n=1 Tax=Diplogelasinospora grovesii TaxID=303347 RepID=A0AAN6NF98_9PEZI|nr:putative RNA methyltransferase [Diplogelasinospora grovesii]
MAEPRSKKRRLDTEDGKADTVTFKQSSSRFKPTIPRDWTISVAIPTSIITDCVTREQRTTTAGRVARALAVFSVDEVVIFDDSPVESRASNADPESYTGDTDPAHFLEHLITYLETPPFMRKTLFPLHPNLRSQGLLPNLEMPHHPHKDEWLPYREGLTLEGRPKQGKGTTVDIGMAETVAIAETIPPRTRLTLKMPDGPRGTPEPVHPATPRTEGGYFWGYSVRAAPSLSGVFTQSAYEGGYDLSIGTSERGLPVSRAFPADRNVDFKHLLIVFGGPRGLEYAAMNDPELSEMSISGSRTRELFDQWVNVLPNQGSRGIRTDEAMLIALTALRGLWETT